MRWKEGGKMGKRAEKKAHQQSRCKWQCTRELQWASCGFIWGDIWYKITAGFTVKSSFHLRNKENPKFSICAPCKCSFNCHGRAATNHAIFKIWNASSPQMHLIFLSHFFIPLIWRILRLFWRGGVLKPSFSSQKLKLPTATRQENSFLTFKPIQLNGNQSLFDQLFTKPRLSVKWTRPRWRASQARGGRMLLLQINFTHHRRRSEQGNYTSIIQLSDISHQAKGPLRGLTEQSLVTLG